MRVGLDLTALGAGGGGVARYAVELLAALARGHPELELEAFTSRDDELPGLRGAAWADRVRQTRLPVSARTPRRGLLATYAGVPALAVAHRLDVLHGPANVGATRLPGVACVVTLHDLIWLHLGDAWGPPAAVAALRRQAGHAVRHADGVLADSAHAARDVVEHLDAPADRVVVASLGVRAPAAPATPGQRDALAQRLGLPAGAPVVLCVAQLRPYKRQDLLVGALADPRLADARLVLPGTPSPWRDELRRRADELGVGDRVVTPGWVSEVDLEALFALATCVALPSEHEGFGLPVLEAMVRGVPVACSDRGSLPEVVADAADRLDVDDPAQVADVLARLVHDGEHRDDRAAAGRRRAAAFGWERTAEATAAAYVAAAERVAGGRRRRRVRGALSAR